MSTQGQHWVVGIGASAGGLEALQAFVSHLDPKVPATFVVAQHLSPNAKSMLVELLARHSKLPVSLATNGQKLRCGCIYVVPPNHDVDISNGRLRLTRLQEEVRPKPSVDHFFESLSRAWGDKAVGIVLSGTGTDGAQGIRLIREAGGLTLAQDDGTARYDGMPRSAVQTGSVDIVLAPDQMARDLESLLLLHPSSEREEGVGPDLLPLLELVRSKTGADFTQYKATTIRRRMEKQMRTSGLKDISSFLEHLKEHPSEIQDLVQESLISVTEFFRDREAFREFELQLEKVIAAKKREDEFRVWVAGCATGEEAYSVCILVLECLRKSGKQLRVKIFATDLDQEAILEARSGVYTEAELRGVSSEIVSRYFVPRGDKFEVQAHLRELIVFARQDLIQSSPFVKLDVVTCRNVLIYFEPPLQQRVFEIFHYALLPEGLLFLGKAENVPETHQLFDAIDKKAKIFRRLNTATRVLPQHFRNTLATRPVAVSRKPTVPLAEMAQREIMRKFDIHGAVVDITGNVQHVMGDLRAYTQLAEGQASLSLTSMLARNAAAELPLLLRRAHQTQLPARSRVFEREGGTSFIIEVRELELKNEGEPFHYLVLFEDLPQLEADPSETAPQREAVEGIDHVERIQELESELLSTREHLQTVIEELGITNEELQSLNEELSSTNEELQASNEQFETTNEELQSTNEELTTLNEELTNKSAELRSANLSLENVQNSIGSAMIVVDTDLKVLRYNELSTKIFDLSPVDLGRELTRISCQYEIPELHEVLIKTVDTGKAGEIMVYGNQHAFQMRIVPCFDERRRITGAIVVFFDNTDLLRTEDRLRTSEERIRLILASSPSPVWMKDTLGRYLMANEAFGELFGVSPSEVIGKTDRELFGPEMAAQMRDGDLEVFYKRIAIRREEKFELGAEHAAKTFLVSRFPLIKDGESSPHAVGTVAIDVSLQVEAQDQLARSESRYRAIVEDQAVFVVRLDPEGQIVFVNRAFLSAFGGRATDYLGRPFLRAIELLDPTPVQSQMNQARAQSSLIPFEQRRIEDDGEKSYRWLIRSIHDDQGQRTEFQAVGFDVTELRHETDLLRDKERIFSQVLDHTSDFLSVFRWVDDEPILEFYNRSIERARGHAMRDWVGRSLREYFLPRQRYDMVLEKFRECARTRTSIEFQDSAELSHGPTFVSVTLVPILSSEGHVERIAAVTRDLSRFKVIEDELRAEKERAELASKSKSDFMASMSHELRTPLNIVLGMAELLADTPLAPDQRHLVSSVQRSGKILLTLIEDILDLSKIEEGKLKLERVYFRLSDLVNDVMESFSMQARNKELELVAKLEPEADQVIFGDPVRIRQVLMNLIGNALKFTEKGSVQIRVRRDPQNPLAFEFRVQDTGIGIHPREHGRIFQKFSQVDSGMSRRFGGTGLGLAICQQLVTLMGGQIGFKSQPGQGSEFWFRLPLPEGPSVTWRTSIPEPQRPQPRPALTAPVRKLKVLAVDDNPDSRLLIGRLLRNMGHEVQVAEGGSEALDKLAGEDYDLVLLDIQMPGLNGYETTEKIRALPSAAAKIPIIALTANAMAGDTEKCLKAGMNAYLSKPINREALQQMLNDWSLHGTQN